MLCLVLLLQPSSNGLQPTSDGLHSFQSLFAPSHLASSHRLQPHCTSSPGCTFAHSWSHYASCFAPISAASHLTAQCAWLNMREERASAAHVTLTSCSYGHCVSIKFFGQFGHCWWPWRRPLRSSSPLAVVVSGPAQRQKRSGRSLSFGPVHDVLQTRLECLPFCTGRH